MLALIAPFPNPISRPSLTPRPAPAMTSGRKSMTLPCFAAVGAWRLNAAGLRATPVG
ncbi:hypothetical protein Ga0080574_TMP3997 [Salipiger abyssi]|uniref:Uncharacterized protein n=1 Tax=Salipiger abyssi TaxID=1250539 RepID=A0A1P8UY70_9RHOB|nr:hypothetical protein Ga0080574_TMP3997 [Salipiger abyssi]